MFSYYGGDLTYSNTFFKKQQQSFKINYIFLLLHGLLTIQSLLLSSPGFFTPILKLFCKLLLPWWWGLVANSPDSLTIGFYQWCTKYDLISLLGFMANSLLKRKEPQLCLRKKTPFLLMFLSHCYSTLVFHIKLFEKLEINLNPEKNPVTSFNRKIYSSELVLWMLHIFAK